MFQNEIHDDKSNVIIEEETNFKDTTRNYVIIDGKSFILYVLYYFIIKIIVISMKNCIWYIFLKLYQF